MAKTYLATTKYNISIKFEVNGIVDKPDIVGAVFGQSEGLIGSEMDLRELQQSGKIGRIEIMPTVSMGKTTGSLIVPSSMDMVQTSLLAAAIESVDKVGPCDAKFETEKIEDMRAQKRATVSERAKELLKKFMQEQIPGSTELVSEIREQTRASEIVEYGPEKLPAGPDIDSSQEIIVVEGRADVINLLRNGITNVIGMDGAKVPQAIIELSKTKSITVFVDGDRGGELNARQLQDLAKVDFVATAPEGKEVEELARKEIVMALRKRIPTGENKPTGSESIFEERMPRRGYGERGYGRPRGRGMGMRSRGGMRGGRSYGPRRSYGDRGYGRPRGRGMGMRSRGYGMGFRERAPRQGFGNTYGEAGYSEPAERREIISAEDKAAFEPVMKELAGTLRARLLGAEKKPLQEVGVRELLPALQATSGVEAIVFDGIITKRLVDEAAAKGVKAVVGIKKGKIEAPAGIKVLTISN